MLAATHYNYRNVGSDSLVVHVNRTLNTSIVLWIHTYHIHGYDHGTWQPRTKIWLLFNRVRETKYSQQK
jgi:hypothetical protein